MLSESLPRHKRENTAERHQKQSRLYGMFLLGSTATVTALAFYGEDIARNLIAYSYNVESAGDRSGLNDDVSLIASRITEKPLRVDCDDAALDAHDARNPRIEDDIEYITAGMVRPSLLPFNINPRVITIREAACATVANFDPASPNRSLHELSYDEYIFDAWQYANDISLVLHEIEHANGIMPEAQAHCYAFQKLPVALETLGMHPNDAHAVSRASAITHADSAPSSYLSEECRPDGEFDLGISDVYIGYEQRS